jgi:transcriptional regulator with XRE-family HTH domain
MKTSPRRTSSKKPEIDLQHELGRTVKLMRKTAKVSQVDFGKLLEVHQTAVCRIEKGFQSLTPEQLVSLSKFFDVSVDSLLASEINFMRIAEKFGTTPPVPERYRQLVHSKMREPYPLYQFALAAKGTAFARKVLSGLDLDEDLFSDLDMPIGVHCNLDIARKLISTGALAKTNFEQLMAQTQSEDAQGFLHRIYSTQESPISLIQSWIVNAHHYEANFKYDITAMNGKQIDLSIIPYSHMADVPYKDETLGDFLCEYKKQYFRQFPAVIGRKPLEVTEKECHFHGHARCIYTIKAA